MHFDEIGELYNEIMNITILTQILWYNKNTVSFIINIGSRTIFIWASQKSVITLILLSFCLMVKKNHATFSTHHNYTQLKPIINRSLAPSTPLYPPPLPPNNPTSLLQAVLFLPVFTLSSDNVHLVFKLVTIITLVLIFLTLNWKLLQTLWIRYHLLETLQYIN